jgi:hypothetical protein
MPTNFKGSFRYEVPFKKKSETCSWSRHCSGALREVVRVLVMLAKKDPVNHFVYAQPKAIQKLCTGKYREGKKKGVKLSLSTVEKCLRLLEELHIVSHELAHSPDYSIQLRGRVITPHGNLCHCYPKVCRYVGVDGGSGIWLRDGAKAVLVTDAFADTGDEAALVQNAEAIPGRVRTNSGPGTSEFRSDSGAGTVSGTVSGTVTDEPNKLKSKMVDEPTVKPPEAPPEENRTYPCESVKPVEPVEPLEPPQSGARNSDQASDAEKQEGRGNPSLTSSSEETDLPKEKAGQAITVEQFFNGITADGSFIAKLSAGYISAETADKWRDHEKLLGTCLQVTNARGAAPLYSNRNLGDLMADIMVTYKQHWGGKTPREWYPTVKRLRSETQPWKT